MCLTLVIRRLMCGFRSGAAALSVLAAAGRLTAALPVLPIQLGLNTQTHVS